ncbi:hypothetical protein CONPUDRAFT_74484 [Coniophora puteana RWD-64-598 SS2]|uniref:Uncharacterized protein n=1 Tax=Coniophora puteana (strain RWD-64-598) TaxID=741705 RepID=A0A5M3MJZ5_CONPW|nr:uncharacterized protein CONPUDRAFT_74484 [Coniophora puteana RWD-64-598 SS2]EIW78921.1 hypothetical protein CONPUDRAFT_74484 [Coniophora puteana RWD-64-598 SS2]
MASEIIIFGRSYYYGVLLSMAFYVLCCDKRRGQNRYLYVLYGFLLLIVTMIGAMTTTVVGQFAFVDDASAFGPALYLLEHYSGYLGILDMAMMIISDFMVNVLTLTSPCYCLAGSTTVGRGRSSSNQRGFFSNTALAEKLGLVWFTLSIVFNNVVTVMICTKLFMAKGEMDKVSPTLSKMYTGLVAIITESAAMTSISGIVFLVLYGLENSMLDVFSNIWAGFSTMSPHLIILRVAMGTAWSSQTAADVSEQSVHSVFIANPRPTARNLDDEDVIELPRRTKLTYQLSADRRREQVAPVFENSLKAPCMTVA